jgi:hypothetical protein
MRRRKGVVTCLHCHSWAVQRLGTHSARVRSRAHNAKCEGCFSNGMAAGKLLLQVQCCQSVTTAHCYGVPVMQPHSNGRLLGAPALRFRSW